MDSGKHIKTNPEYALKGEKVLHSSKSILGVAQSSISEHTFFLNHQKNTAYSILWQARHSKSSNIKAPMDRPDTLPPR